MLLKLVQKCFDIIGMQQGSPVRTYLRKIALCVWSSLLYYPLLIKIHFIQKHYKNVLKRLHEKASKNEKIVVGFYVIFDSKFTLRSVFEKMLQDDFFDPYIVIAPDLGHGKESQIEEAKKTYESSIQKYGLQRVILGYDYQTDTYSDPSDLFDIISPEMPYDNETHKFYTMNYLCRKDVLTFHSTYGYPVTRNLHYISGILFSALVWRYFVENEMILSEMKKNSLYPKNLFTVGYPKMDSMPDNIPHEQKTIIIAPHYTVSPRIYYFSLSTFLSYAQLFQELPQKYPNIRFVFRPHPSLLSYLVNNDIWTQNEVDKYMQTLLSNENVIYSNGGEYFDLFASSDGIIHDCGSFTVEYMFTEKPGCYLLRDEAEIKEEFIQFGQKVLEYCYYKAFTEEDIINYIDNVILKGEDPLKEKRETFVRTELKINYKNVSDNIIQYLKNQILSNECN